MIIRRVIRGNRKLFEYDKKKQEEFINKLSSKYDMSKIDYTDRSYCQYKCQTEYYTSLKIVFLNFICLFFIPIFITYCALVNAIKNIFIKYEKEINNSAIFFGNDGSVIPESVKVKYSIVNCEKQFMLKKKDIKFYIKEVFLRYPLLFYFQAKILYKIAFYSWNINKYDPKALIVTSEYSYTSSILTKYCEFSDVEHINVMHGDKLYYIRDSFFKFHKCYVWHKHYVELFCKLSADFNQFVIEIPQKFHIIDDKIKSDNGDGRKIITYYLQTQNEKEMISVRNNLSKLNGSYSIIIRVHPIYTDNRMAEKIFREYKIQYNDVEINKSIADSDILISMYSTVLFQAYLNKKNIVIDDVSKPGLYDKLLDMESILVNLPHIKLSEFLFQKVVFR